MKGARKLNLHLKQSLNDATELVRNQTTIYLILILLFPQMNNTLHWSKTDLFHHNQAMISYYVAHPHAPLRQ